MTGFIPLSDLLSDHLPFDESEAVALNSLRQFLHASDNPYDRSNLFAHTVCDAWVVSPDRKQVLLLVHGEGKQWCAPGGHADGSPDMLAAARRELLEEAGLGESDCSPLLSGRIFDINAGLVPERQKPHGLEPAHVHFDICFAFEANPSQVTLSISDESLDLKWVPVGEALSMVMPCHQRRVRKTLAGRI